MPDEALRVASPKGATAAKKENGFQKGGLPRAVTTPYEVLPWMEPQLRALDAAHVIDN